MIHYNYEDEILTNIVHAFSKRLKSDVDLEMKVDNTLGEFTGKIENGVISAGCHAQLCEVAGRYLRNPKISGAFVSKKSVRGIYFATHYNNYYDSAPIEEICNYIEDLAFWGMNWFSVWFDMHHYRDMKEGEAQSDKLIAMYKHAKSLGINISIGGIANEAFKDSPKHLRADWTSGHDGYIYDLNDHYHIEICPSKEGGMEQIISNRKKMLEVFCKELQFDGFSLGAYDEGGCTCKECAPWGGNGYLRILDELIPIYKEYMKGTPKLTLNTWQFGTFTGNDVEFKAIEKAVEEKRFDGVYAVQAEPQYARYPFEHNWPSRITGFPEISMYAASPWGGYGANPMPKHFQEIWNCDGNQLDGGNVYSEGLYEDINKVIFLRFYQDNQSAEETVREYLGYEFGLKGELLDEALDAVMHMDETLERDYELPVTQDAEGRRILKDPKTIIHRYVIKNAEKVEEIEKTICKINEALPKEIQSTKKWQLIYLRALIDGELKRNNYYRNDTVMEYFKQLVKLSYLQNAGIHTHPDVYDENFGRNLLA